MSKEESMPSRAKATATTDHDEIRRWAEERGATPACVRDIGGKGDMGMLRLDFPGHSGEESLEPIEWDQWFEVFDEEGLALLYQETTASGAQSNFNKLVSRDSVVTSKRRSLPAKPVSRRASATEKAISRSKPQSKRSAEVTPAQKHKPIEKNVNRKQEGAKPSPNARPRRRVA